MSFIQEILNVEWYSYIFFHIHVHSEAHNMIGCTIIIWTTEGANTQNLVINQG